MAETNNVNRDRIFFRRLALLTMLTLVLFLFAMFFVLLPSFRTSLMSEKRLQIRELTETAWSILDQSYDMAETGMVSPNEAKQRAISRINGLRYGDQMKDYFWVIDEEPRMVVHPYRPELNGQLLSEYRDTKGARLFVDIVHKVQAEGDGYVNYHWQWKDDARKVASKLSYVKEFAPWRWVIGTGVYVDEVEVELSRITDLIINWTLAVSIFIALMLWCIIHEGAKNAKMRKC